MKTHLRGEPGKTLCGKWIASVERGELFAGRVIRARAQSLLLIGKNDLVDSATCKACQRVDDVKQVRDYNRECAEAGIDPTTGKSS